MEKFKIQIPEITYLSEWPGFDRVLSTFGNKIIVNKIVCGCGMTDYYLTDNTMPVILASPRRELIVSKKKDPRTQHAYYFDRSDASVSMDDSVQRLFGYIDTARSNQFYPKIMCTYDSLGKVTECLRNWNVLDGFVIIGDEVTCVFTDAPMKGAKSIEILNLFDALPNRCIFITATPLKESYLDEVPVFKDMAYISCEWPKDRLLPVFLKPKKMTNTVQAIGDIIDTFRHYGYFQTKSVNGVPAYSKEGVFYLNSLTDIINIIKKKGLTSNDTRVICADNTENSRDLKDVGFEIGHFPGQLEYKTENKTFTFATRCSFEGADLHSDCASVYIFSDSNRKNLSLDISIDIVQIIGRCRTQSNPFRDEIQYFYKFAATEQIDSNSARMEVDKKLAASKILYDKFKNEDSPVVFDMLEDAQTGNKAYRKNYITVINDFDGKRRVEINQLVRLAELRAIDIKEQYKSKNTLYSLLRDSRIVPQTPYANLDPSQTSFLQTFDELPDFSEKMRLFSEACATDNQFEQWALSCEYIPLSYKNFYTVLGIRRIRQQQYDYAKMEADMDYFKYYPTIVEKLNAILIIGQEYTNKHLKTTIQSVYDEIGLKKTGKASQIKEFFPESYETKVRVVGGYANGYKIFNN